MHQNNICHRDLKPENFLFTTKDPIEKASLKVIDFGLACKFAPGQNLTTKAGTPYYVAPQVLQGKYDEKSDCWSLGVIMYVVLCGYPPFYGDTDADVLAKVKLGNLTFSAADWKNITDDAKRLVKNLLKMNPKERFSASEALEDIWIKEKAPKSKAVPIGSSLVDNLKGFRSTNKLKKAALYVIAGNLSETQIKGLRDIFMTLDGNGDGLLTATEMKEGIAKANLKETDDELKQLLEAVDSDGSGVVDYTEFLAAALDKKTYMAENQCWQAFRVFDRDGNGKISKAELAHVLNDDGVKEAANGFESGKEIAELLKEVDKNGDGEIDFDEFMAMMKGQQ